MTHRFRSVRGAVVASAALMATTGCTHSDVPTLEYTPTQGPYGTTSPFRLTFNPGQDIYPSYSDDGRSILYTFQAPGRSDRDRCLGILPAEGGSRRFELCELRPGYADSTDMIAAGGLSADGRLLYLQTSARVNAQLPLTSRLFLTDTTQGAARRVLLTLPMPFLGTSIDWLADVHWIADDAFLALVQQFTVVPAGGASRDTVIIPIAVARGTITATGASLTAIPWTNGAASYARSNDGAAILVNQTGSLMRVPLDGAAPTVVPITGLDASITGFDCQDGRCIVLTSTSNLYSVAETGGAATFRASAAGPRWTWPRLSPLSDDFIVVSTVTGLDLYLFRGLL